MTAGDTQPFGWWQSSVLVLGDAEHLGGSSGTNRGQLQPYAPPMAVPLCCMPRLECTGPTGNTGLLGPVILLMTLGNGLPALEGAELLKSAQTQPGCAGAQGGTCPSPCGAAGGLNVTPPALWVPSRGLFLPARLCTHDFN